MTEASFLIKQTHHFHLIEPMIRHVTKQTGYPRL